MMAVETTCAPHIATSCTATGVPILSAVLRIDASNLCSSRRRQSWPFLAQQKYSIRRLTTAQASIVPRPAPKTPCFGIRSVLKITSSTHMTAFKMLGVSISPAHWRKDDVREDICVNGSIHANVRK